MTLPGPTRGKSAFPLTPSDPAASRERRRTVDGFPHSDVGNYPPSLPHPGLSNAVTEVFSATLRDHLVRVLD